MYKSPCCLYNIYSVIPNFQQKMNVLGPDLFSPLFMYIMKQFPVLGFPQLLLLTGFMNKCAVQSTIFLPCLMKSTELCLNVNVQTA
jgi:hypothetical protein